MSRVYPVLLAIVSLFGESKAFGFGANTDFDASCLVFAQGYEETPDGRLATRFAPAPAGCQDAARLTVSVTHENAQNNHAGSRNENARILSYQVDFDSHDPGTWLSAALSDSRPQILTLRLDTTGPERINVTGWPISYGHMFLGAQNSSISSALDADVAIAFDARISSEPSGALENGYAGARVLLGALGVWNEGVGRANTAHFLELDLRIAEGYALSYGDPIRSGCQDRSYDRCFYDPGGRYAEGRFLVAGDEFGNPQQLSDGWVHYRFALSQSFRSLGWVVPPANWGAAKITALYFAIESEGGARTQVELRHYQASLN